jgi:hypothetical protein
MESTRRTLLAAAGALALLPRLSFGAESPKATSRPPGKPGDFDFLAGEWKISHRMLKGKVWDEFEGEATCWTVLGGIGSIEELRIPARDFSGIGIRLLDVGQKVWSDFWVNAKSGVLGAEGLKGTFDNGVGTFVAEDKEDGKPVLYRGVWDEIDRAKGRHRWHQGFSKDGGKTWSQTWVMQWRKA